MTLSKRLTEYEREYERIESEFSHLVFHDEIKGTLIEKYVKCGRAGCPCNQGKLHGPYYYIEIIQNGKQTFQYVKKKDLKELLPLYEENKQYKKTRAQLNKLDKQIKHLKYLAKSGIEKERIEEGDVI